MRGLAIIIAVLIVMNLLDIVEIMNVLLYSISHFITNFHNYILITISHFITILLYDLDYYGEFYILMAAFFIAELFVFNT
jgi:hypothetical protein